jgi:predicted cytidylate kinase
MDNSVASKTKITIGGASGTGKGTIRSLLAKKINYKEYSVGDFFRLIAEEKGFDSLLAFQESIHGGDADDATIDKMVDEKTVQFGKLEDNFVIEGRLAAHMIPQACNVLFVCETEVRIARVASRQKLSHEEAESETLRREKLYSSFYDKHYGIENFLDEKYYNLVIDTSQKRPEEIVEEIITYINNIVE